MNEHLPYEDELKKRLVDLPLPNEDIAWEDMKRRLEKDDEDRPIIPPVLKGCGYTLLFLLFIVAFWFIADPVKWLDDKSQKVTIKSDSIENKKQENRDNINRDKRLTLNDTNKKIVLNNDTSTQKSTTRSTLANDTSIKEEEILKKRSSDRRKNEAQKEYISTNKKNIKKNNPFKEQNNKITVKNNLEHIPAAKKINGKINKAVPGNLEADTVISDPRNIKEIEELQPDKAKKNIPDITREAKPGTDSLKNKTTDTTAHNRKIKRDSLRQKSIYFGAGLGVHQLLPVGGQQSNPYNSLGRKSSFADYIPSAYVRMYKDNKWFIQSELRYGAPQYTKEILFIQKKIIDSSGPLVTSSSRRLKKTFYHQLPVSFNYFVLRGFSTGAGVTFNKFSSAIVQQDINRTNLITQTDSLISTGIVSQKKADSNFVTSYMQAHIEMQYQRKRFSAGARYSFGLQPYLKFKLPGGEQREETNSSLQLFIRFELWRSGKRKW